jgi:hypothetical protein
MNNLNILLLVFNCRATLIQSFKLSVLGLAFFMITPTVNKVYCNAADQFYLKVNGDTVFVEEIEDVHSIKVDGPFPDSIFDSHGITYENISKETWTLIGNLDSIPQGLINSYSINPAYKNNLDDTIYLKDQIVVYWEENVTTQQRSSFENQYNLIFYDEILKIAVFDVDDPFAKSNEVLGDQMVKYSMPNFLSRGFACIFRRPLCHPFR